MDKKFTIRDIAEMAGVSKGTVDRVLHKRGKVSDSALKRVTEVLDKIEYTPNPIAKNLKQNKVYTIAVLLPDSENDPFWLPCMEAIEDIKQKYKQFGIRFIAHVYTTDDTASFISESEAILAAKPDALLMVPLFQKEARTMVQQCVELGIKTSLFNNNLHIKSDFNFIGQDLYKSGRIAANLFHKLIHKGHIGILHIDEFIQNATHLQEKEHGFKTYFEELPANTFQITRCTLTHEKSSDYEATLVKFLKSNPDLNGIFITISKAYNVAGTIHKHIAGIPIIGYDLVPQNVELLLNGELNLLINQNQKKQVELGLSYFAEYFLFGKDIPEKTLLPIDIITTENFEEYLL